VKIESNRKVKTGLAPWLRVCRAIVRERLFSCHCLCQVVCAPGRIAGYDQDLVVPVLAYYACYVHVCTWFPICSFLFLFVIVLIAVVLFLLARMHVY
jgi:hypothetical protein